MYTLFQAIYSKYCGNPQYNISILGLQNTGKTQIFKAIKEIKNQYKIPMTLEYKPTVGLNTMKYQENKNNLWIWDLGGRNNIRKIWESYFSESHGFIFVIDGRVEEGIQCLRKVITHHEMAAIPCAILLRQPNTKQIIEQKIKQIEKQQEGQSRPWLIQKVPMNKQAMEEILDWLYQQIRKIAISLKY